MTRVPRSHDITIPADDGFPLAATLFEPSQARTGVPLVVVGAATAVPRRYYGQFAAFLAAHGHPAITFDYRGVSQSRPKSLVGFDARMRDWGILDIPGVLTFAQKRFSGHPIHWVGNSYGGFGTGLAHNNHLIARQLAVSSMSAWLGHLPPAMHYRLRFLMSGPMRISSHVLGYFPGALMGGEDLPKGVALEWSRWCRSPGFLFGDDTLAETRHFASFRAPIRFAFTEDDDWVAQSGVEELASRFPNAAERSIWKVRVDEAGGQKIGHVGFFKPTFKPTLWPRVLEWLGADQSADIARSA